MSEISENTEVNEIERSLDEIECIDSDFEAELDSKCEEYTSEGRSLEDIQQNKEKLLQIREVLISYKESQEVDTNETDDGDEDPEKVLILRRYR